MSGIVVGEVIAVDGFGLFGMVESAIVKP